MSLDEKVQHKAGVELNGGPFVKSYILEADVKQFIKELIKNDFINTNGQFIIELRKLAGEGLI